MSYSKAIYNAITGFLDDDDWKYSFDEERELIRAGVSLVLSIRSWPSIQIAPPTRNAFR